MEGHFDRFWAPPKIALKMRKHDFWRGWGCRMAGFPIFLETMDRGLSFGTGFKFLAPLGEAVEFFENRVWAGPEGHF